MGSAFELGVVHSSKEKAQEMLLSGVNEIRRIEELLTEFSSKSFTSKLNNESGKKAIEIPKEMFDLLSRCNQLSLLTQGFFDITVGPLKQLYKFKNSDFSFPSDKAIRKALQKTGFQSISLDKTKQTAYLEKEDMHISFAAIGKGYAADMVKKLWLQKGITSGYINASGDLSAFGNNEHGKPWNIGIANPDQKEDMLFFIPIKNSSIATSGDYEQHFLYKGKRYSHNISPKNGRPLEGIKSVSVISPSAELSDALATAVYAMGIQKGINFIEQLPNTHTIIITEQNNIHFSKDLNYETNSQA